MLPLLRPDLRSRVLFVLAGSLSLQGVRSAAAQPATDMAASGSNIVMDLKLPDGNGGFSLTTDETIIREFMNLAHCTCASTSQGRDASTFQVDFRLEPRSAIPSPTGDDQIDVWVGRSCQEEDLTQQRSQCFYEQQIAEVNDLVTTVANKNIPVNHLAGAAPSGACDQRHDEEIRWVWAIIDQDSDGFDEGDYQNHSPPDIPTDTLPPPEPLNIRAHGTENAVEISWEQPTSRETDIDSFQVLCARVDDPGNTDEFGGIEPLYTTARQLCPGDGDDGDGVCPRLPGDSARIVPGGPDAGTGPDAGSDDAGPVGEAGPCVIDLPDGLTNLDPAYLCGPSKRAAGTAGSVHAEGLTNGVAYRVVLLVIDKARNVTAIALPDAYTPLPVQDFWEGYKDQGGRAVGGCNAAQAGLGGGLALLFALGLGLWLVSRRRRTGRGRGGPGAPASGVAGGAAVLIVLALSPGRAAAQPWWEDYDNEPVQEAVGPSRSHWGVEFKFGPYVPDVDSEFNLGSGEVGPFERIYGDGPFLMSQLTVDYYFLYPLGQLGLSGTAGYLGHSANGFQQDLNGEVVTDPDTGEPERSPGSRTGFRLIPASLGVVYRFTELDDRWAVPLVPYGRLGVSYYTWWSTKPDGSTSEVPTSRCPDLESNDCDGDRARGGSLGWQATAGIAIRAERIDRDAELSMRNELGVEHAGLVFEFTYAKVDGFGAKHKLAVGDATFFGGINFEF